MFLSVTRVHRRHTFQSVLTKNKTKSGQSTPTAYRISYVTVSLMINIISVYNMLAQTYAKSVQTRSAITWKNTSSRSVVFRKKTKLKKKKIRKLNLSIIVVFFAS